MRIFGVWTDIYSDPAEYVCRLTGTFIIIFSCFVDNNKKKENINIMWNNNKTLFKFMRSIFCTFIITFGLIAVIASGGGGGDDESVNSGGSTDSDDTVYTIGSLAEKLAETASTDAEKSQAIWLWITDNIAYDLDSSLLDIHINTSAEKTLEDRKGVCHGYANLFYALAVEMDLEAKVIFGYAKGNDYLEGQVFENVNHAWNAVKIDGTWQLLDATWGAGMVNNNVWEKIYDENWYRTDPEYFIFSHMPENDYWQLLDTPITKTRFEELPNLKPVFFSWGFLPQDVYDLVDDANYRGIVKQYGLTEPRDEVDIIAAPLSLYLDAGTEYVFTIYIPDSLAVSLINDSGGTETWYWCHDDTGDLPPYEDLSNYPGIDSGTKLEGTYTFNITPETGSLLLADMYLSGTSQVLLEYIVE